MAVAQKRRASNHSANGRHPGISRKVSDVVESVKELGAETKYTAQEQLAATRDTAVDYLEEGRRQAMKMEQSLEERIREKPLTAVLVAAGVGLAFGFVMRRR